MSTSPRRTRRHRQRQQLYEAALAAFRRDGFEAARIEDIADIAGVARSCFYYHFADKHEVLLEWLHLSTAGLGAELRQTCAKLGLRAALARAADALAARWEGEPALLRDVALVATPSLFCGAAGHSAAEVATGPRSACRSWTSELLADLFRAAVERGELAVGLKPHERAALFLVNLLAAAHAWSRAPGASSLRAAFAAVAKRFVNGVRGRSSAISSTPARTPRRGQRRAPNPASTRSHA